MRIVIIKTAAIGDVLRTTCILPGLKERYPNSSVIWITGSTSVDLLKGNPLISELIEFDHLESSRYAALNGTDLLISLDDDPSTCRLASTISPQALIGAYMENGEPRYTNDAQSWFDMGLISRFGKSHADSLKKANRASYPDILFRMLGIPPGSPSLMIPESERTQANQFAKTHLSADYPVIGLNTGAGARWKFKQLDEAKTAHLADQLHREFGPNILLFGGMAESHRNRRIMSLAQSRLVNVGSDHSLLQFSALIECCDIVISSDSLALHIASAVGIPAVAFFGPTSASEVLLFGGGEKIIADIPCACCYLADCDIHPTCMDLIETTEIINAVEALMSAK
ncbi:glycosyltransferase family 9 protein [Gammaproteobacteria bacterium]|nr:glycosyltransferase family 9 protein [Gammaproteobacteria bacterium]